MSVPPPMMASVRSPLEIIQDHHLVTYLAATPGRAVWVEVFQPGAQSVLLEASAPAWAPRAVPSAGAVSSGLRGYGARPVAIAGDVTVWLEDGGASVKAAASGRVTTTRVGPGALVGAPVIAPSGTHAYVVRERNSGGTTVHDVVALNLSDGGHPVVVAEGHDFYGAPALSPDGTRLAFVAWDHPMMPWDESSLLELELLGPTQVVATRVVSVAPDVAITQPRYDHLGRLHYVSDVDGWWSIYRVEASGGSHELVLGGEIEYGRPEWNAGLDTYGFLENGTLVAAGRTPAGDLIVHRPIAGEAVTIEVPVVRGLVAAGAEAVAIEVPSSGRPVITLWSEAEPVRRLLHTRTSAMERRQEPRRLLFEGPEGVVTAWYHPPLDHDLSAPPSAVLMCHGGPTIQAEPVADHETDAWTRHGFAYVTINFHGSTGSGRAFRQALRGRFGELDAVDVAAVYKGLKERGLIDGKRTLLRGRSSGAVTAVNAAALTAPAGLVLYSGVYDLAATSVATHKMESYYLDGLVGNWPEHAHRYSARSPINRSQGLTAPVLLVHGAQDEVVPVSQARHFADALLALGTPVRLIEVPGQGHALRDSEILAYLIATELTFADTVVGTSRDATSKRE